MQVFGAGLALFWRDQQSLRRIILWGGMAMRSIRTKDVRLSPFEKIPGNTLVKSLLSDSDSINEFWSSIGGTAFSESFSVEWT